ncbi:VWA domain-containing protein [Bacillus solitudinis]|uniref:VWA domain-containing protein n=1 Tax=Bacillus solitudinis TaxID=2014074 RepID=UPI000C237ABE|nr:VWA domain-containing protein [Bacillus solitudinis]
MMNLGRRLQYKNLVLFILAIAIITGCSKENSELVKEIEEIPDEEIKAEKSVEKVVEEPTLTALAEIEGDIVPTTLEDVLNFSAGPFAGLEFDEEDEQFQEALAPLPALGEDASEEEIEQYLYNILQFYAEEYPDPNVLVNRWEQLSFGSPEVEDPRYEIKENFNVEIILDSSGSMKEDIGGQQKLDLAKEAILEFANQLPEEAKVALRVYGHIGQSEEVSCKRADRVYDLQPYNEAAFSETLEEFFPNGWTPIAHALEETKKDFAELKGENNTNVIFLVSDGIESCHGDPVQVAKELGESDIMPIVNIIGFDVPSDEQQQLKDMAAAANGVYTLAKNQDQLREELNRTNEMAQMWFKWWGDSKQEIFTSQYEQKKEINDESFLWKSTANREWNNVVTSVNLLWKKDKKISLEQSNIMGEILIDRRDAIHEIGDTLFNRMTESNTETFESLREEIDKMYEDQKRN